MNIADSIVILDFGGQYAHLIASRIRRFGYKAYILPTETKAHTLKNVAGIILSGGPQSVYDKGSPQADPKIFDLGIPVLGLCYGHQWVAHALGGKVTPATVKEYGETDVKKVESAEVRKFKENLFAGLPSAFTVWMSHGDEVSALPEGFVTVASSKDCINAAFMHPERKIFGIQFHIEVTHTEHGMDLLRKFVDLCAPESWNMESYSAHIGEEILKEVGDKRVFMLVSGGVDSTVAFTLLNKVLGPDRVQGLLVDTGLMRKNEVKKIQEAFQPLNITNLHVVDASDQFFRNLHGVYDPEEKRRIIGNTFLDVQKRVFEEMGLDSESQNSQLTAQSSSPTAHTWLLGQGTIYPDTIETGGTKHADKIKTHHNRVPMIQEMMERGLVIEPLKELYKDEVRQLGEELGLPHDLVWRHPFPGPGLGVRILCGESEWKVESAEVRKYESMILPVRSVGVQGDGRTYRHALAVFSKNPIDIPELHWSLATSIPNSDKTLNRVLQCLSHAEPFATHFTPTYLTHDVADLLREADAIVDEEVRKADLYKAIWQFPVVLLPFGAEKNTYSVVLRPIESTDAMTARAYPLPKKVLQTITDRILKREGISAVFLDLTNKPPGTIEWE